MAFDFNGALETSHAKPRPARYLGHDDRTGAHRVLVMGDYQWKCLERAPQYNWATVWLYDDEGRCRGADGSGAEFDLIRIEARRAA